MSTLHEIKSAIAHLDAREKAILTAELFALDEEPDPVQLERSIVAGLEDVDAGRVRPLEEVSAMIPGWITKS